MDKYISGTQFDKVTLLPDNPFLIQMLKRMSAWDVSKFGHDRTRILTEWVKFYQGGASFEEMMCCSHAKDYQKWFFKVNANKSITEKYANDYLATRVDLIRSIADGNYNEALWNNEQDWFPIRITVDASGAIYSFDGAHRSIILAACNHPVVANIELMHHLFWQQIETINTLYQPSCHPLVAHLRATRKDLARYQAIGNKTKEMGLKSVCELGCAEAEGLTLVQQISGCNILGIENHGARYLLASALCAARERGKIKQELGNNVAFDGCIGLSIWHHLAETLPLLDQWIDKTKQAPVHFIEMPEPGSKTIHESLLQETGWTLENAGDNILDRIIKRGGYQRQEILFVDPNYANRQTIIISR